MSQLYAITVVPKDSWDKRTKTCYVVQDTKEGALAYLNQSLENNWQVKGEVRCLGEKLGGILYVSGVRKPRY